MATSFWGFLAIIIVFAVIGDSVVKIVRVSKSGGSKASDKRLDDLESDMASMEQDLEDARERIVVLEKIVTDDKYNLGKQIDDLASN